MMNSIRKTSLVSFLLLLLVASTSAQNLSTQGKDFWVSFMTNGYWGNITNTPPWVKTQVLVSAKRSCSGTITNPNTGWRTTFTVEAGNISSINIPYEVAYHGEPQNESVENLGLRIVTTDTVSVYCTNIATNSFDASFVLPIQALADDYLVQCCKQSTSGTSFQPLKTSAALIVATQDGTSVAIRPSVQTNSGHPANETFTITLNAGQSYQIRSIVGGDLSGTRITAADCAKIAVFNGNTITCVPENAGNGFDHVFEQAMPLRSWGKRFMVTGSKNRNRDFVKITSSANNNLILKNGSHLVTLQANESYYFELPASEASCALEASQPSAVYMYHNSNHDTNDNGDPSMVWIAPVEQRINEITFSTFSDVEANISRHFVNIIVPTKDITKVNLDGQPVSFLSFTPVNGSSEYSFARIEIQHGVHHLECESGFNAHVYGFGYAKGYAYLIGSNASDLACSLTLNELIVKSNECFDYCIDEPVTFSAEINYPEYDLIWDFGDGATSTQNPAHHTYTSKNVYDVRLIVNAEESGCNGETSDTTSFFVDVRQHYATPIERTLCAGESFNEYGIEIGPIFNDTVIGFFQDNELYPNCQDSVLVYITVLPTYHEHLNSSRCWRGVPEWYIEHGFSFQYDHPGVYEEELQLESINGCDSTISLTLTVASQIVHSFSANCCEPTYYWDGRPYTEPGDYTYTYPTPSGCDSIVTLHLTFFEAVESEFTEASCQPYEWEGVIYTSPGDYTRVFQTVDGCDSIVTAHLVPSSETIEGGTDHLESCDSVTWMGKVYHQSGFYNDTLTSGWGCDSIVHLNLVINQAPESLGIVANDTCASHWVIPANEFMVYQYSFFINDIHGDNSTWDSIHWQLTSRSGNPINWIIEPTTTGNGTLQNGCRVHVLSYTSDTIDLHATVFNGCSHEGSHFSHWMVCTSYDIGENQAQSGFSVLPNPNNGSMTLSFKNYTGKANLKVIDMTGNLIDDRTLHINTNASQPYSLPRLADGLYYFIVSFNNRVATEKVLIINN